jgi:hypothetical protein
MRQFILFSLFMFSLLIVVNIIGWMMPFLTHPIVFTIWFGSLMVVIYKFWARDAR